MPAFARSTARLCQALGAAVVVSGRALDEEGRIAVRVVGQLDARELQQLIDTLLS